MDFDAKKTILVSFFLISAISVGFADEASNSLITFAPTPHADSTVRVKTLVEVAGSLRFKSENDQLASIPLKVTGEMFYDEQGQSGTTLPAVRHYWTAKADIDIDGKEMTRELRKDRSVILLNAAERSDRFTSPHGPLTRDELELLDVAGSAFPPEQLLPSDPKAIGDTWEHADDTMAQLLRLDEIESGEATSELVAIEDGRAKIELVGKAKARVSGIASEVEVKGSYQFDLATKCVTWLSLSVKEQREVSLATPGFNVVSRIRIARKRVDSSEALTPALLSKIDLANNAGRLLEYRSADDRYRLALDRRWHLISERDSLAVLRLVDDGDLIATCKLDRLHRLASGNELTLGGFQEDVQRALDTYCEQIVDATESVSPQGIRLLRVEAAGTVEKTPVRWVYYHLSNKEGDRLSAIFTFEASRLEQFVGVDESLTSSVQFLGSSAAQARATDPAELK